MSTSEYEVKAKVELIVTAQDEAAAELKAKELLEDICSEVEIRSVEEY
jgi:hypothetical protein